MTTLVDRYSLRQCVKRMLNVLWLTCIMGFASTLHASSEKPEANRAQTGDAEWVRIERVAYGADGQP